MYIKANDKNSQVCIKTNDNEAYVCLKRKIIASMYYKNSDKCKAFRTMNTN